MPAFSNALRSLSNPMTVASLAILLLNDHLLKVLMPSWLTGKLSDFAGLFFFPFLLAALLAFLVRDRSSNRRIGMLAFAITAVWFTLMKTTTWGNAFTEEFASFVLQTRAQIIQDPTDMMALSVLVPGWVLWEKKETSKPPRWAWLVLFIAAFASMGTPAPPAAPEITTVVYDQSGFHARSRFHDISAVSQDGGKSWRTTEPDDIAGPNRIPRVENICEPQLPLICYRIDNEKSYGVVQESADGGDTWRTVWELPQGRIPLKKRLARISCPPCDESTVFRPDPSSLAIGEPYGSNGQATLVVALGTEGVAVKSPDGKWEQYAVGIVVPTEAHIHNLGQWQVIRPEIENWLYIGLVVLGAYGFFGWFLCVGKEAWKLSRPLWFCIGVILIGTFFIYSALGEGLLRSFSLWVYPLVLLIMLIGLAGSNQNVQERAASPLQAKSYSRRALVVAAAISTFPWLPMLAWAFGIIDSYNVANSISIAFAIIICIAALITLKRGTNTPGTPDTSPIT